MDVLNRKRKKVVPLKIAPKRPRVSSPYPKQSSRIITHENDPGPSKRIPLATLNAKKLPVKDMVTEAIKSVGLPKKGASYPAIKKWITDKEPLSNNMNNRIKKAVLKGVEDGTLVRPTKYKNAIGAVGFFALAPDQPKTSVAIKNSKKIKDNINFKPTFNNQIAPKKQPIPSSEKVTNERELLYIFSDSSEEEKRRTIKKTASKTAKLGRIPKVIAKNEDEVTSNTKMATKDAKAIPKATGVQHLQNKTPKSKESTNKESIKVAAKRAKTKLIGVRQMP